MLKLDLTEDEARAGLAHLAPPDVFPVERERDRNPALWRFRKKLRKAIAVEEPNQPKELRVPDRY